jgi:hypothetical protein
MGFSSLASIVQDVERVLSNEGDLPRAAVGMIDVISKIVLCLYQGQCTLQVETNIWAVSVQSWFREGASGKMVCHKSANTELGLANRKSQTCDESSLLSNNILTWCVNLKLSEGERMSVRIHKNYQLCEIKCSFWWFITSTTWQLQPLDWQSWTYKF